jgi:hypothetical protein
LFRLNHLIVGNQEGAVAQILGRAAYP